MENIWEKDKELNRSYTADFEVYGKEFRKNVKSEVESYIDQIVKKINIIKALSNL